MTFLFGSLKSLSIQKALEVQDGVVAFRERATRNNRVQLSHLFTKHLEGLIDLLVSYCALVGFQGDRIRGLVIAQLNIGPDFDRGGEAERRIFLDLDTVQRWN